MANGAALAQNEVVVIKRLAQFDALFALSLSTHPPATTRPAQGAVKKKN